jgi:hypothetical protein
VRAFPRVNRFNGLACGKNVYFRGGPIPTKVDSSCHRVPFKVRSKRPGVRVVFARDGWTWAECGRSTPAKARLICTFVGTRSLRWHFLGPLLRQGRARMGHPCSVVHRTTSLFRHFRVPLLRQGARKNGAPHFGDASSMKSLGRPTSRVANHKSNLFGFRKFFSLNS